MENKKGKLGSRLAGSEAFLSVAASLVCIVIGLLLGLIVLAIINAEHAFGDGLMVILQSGFKSPRNMGTDTTAIAARWRSRAHRTRRACTAPPRRC